MGLFSKSNARGAAGLQRLSRALVTGVLDARDATYFVDVDGDAGGFWDDQLFYFFVMGDRHEVFQIRGKWNRRLPTGLRTEVLELTNEWNIAKIWPKVYARDENDSLAIYTEISVDFGHGVTTDQLDSLLERGIVTGLNFFATAGERFPDVSGVGAS